MINMKVVRIEDLKKDPLNPRLSEDIEHVVNLMKNWSKVGFYDLPKIREDPQAKGKYLVFDGWYRVRAIEEMGLDTVECELEQLSDAEVYEMLTSKEEFHLDLNPWERGKLYKGICETKSLSEEDVAKLYGYDRTMVNKCIAVYENITQEEMMDVNNSHPSLNHLRILASIKKDDKARKKVIALIKEEITYNDLKKIVGCTNVVKALLDGESEEDYEVAVKEFEPQFYTREITDLERIKYRLEEIAGDSHHLKKIYLPIDKFKDWKEADNFAKAYGGRYLKKVTVEMWVLEVDRSYQMEKEDKK